MALEIRNVPDGAIGKLDTLDLCVGPAAVEPAADGDRIGADLEHQRARVARDHHVVGRDAGGEADDVRAGRVRVEVVEAVAAEARREEIQIPRRHAGVAVVVELVAARAAVVHVIADLAGEEVAVVAAFQHIVARAAEQAVPAGAAGEVVVPGNTPVVVVPAVRVAVAAQEIVAVAAVDDVRAAAALEVVLALPPVDEIVAGGTGKLVIARRTVEHPAADRRTVEHDAAGELEALDLVRRAAEVAPDDQAV